MLGKDPVRSTSVRGPRHVVQRRVSFPQRYNVLLVTQNRKQLAESPYPALVLQLGRTAALFPQPAQCGHIGRALSQAGPGSICLVRSLTVTLAPGRILDLVQIAALWAAEILFEVCQRNHARASRTAQNM